MAISFKSFKNQVTAALRDWSIPRQLAGQDATSQAAESHHSRTYRSPFSEHWEERPLDWAVERIAHLVKQTRDETFVHQSLVVLRQEE